ncbi:flagellar hook-length control protein FliK [Thermosulfuriphilus sp.]
MGQINNLVLNLLFKGGEQSANLPKGQESLVGDFLALFLGMIQGERLDLKKLPDELKFQELNPQEITLLLKGLESLKGLSETDKETLVLGELEAKLKEDLPEDPKGKEILALLVSFGILTPREEIPRPEGLEGQPSASRLMVTEAQVSQRDLLSMVEKANLQGPSTDRQEILNSGSPAEGAEEILKDLFTEEVPKGQSVGKGSLKDPKSHSDRFLHPQETSFKPIVVDEVRLKRPVLPTDDPQLAEGHKRSSGEIRATPEGVSRESVNTRLVREESARDLFQTKEILKDSKIQEISPGPKETEGFKNADIRSHFKGPDIQSGQVTPAEPRHERVSHEGQPIRVSPQEFVETVEQIIVRGPRSGPQRVTLHIHPPDLGRVELEVRYHRGQVETLFRVENHQVKEIVQAGLPRLEQALESQGIKLIQSQVDVGAYSFGGGQQEAFERRGGPGKQGSGGSRGRLSPEVESPQPRPLKSPAQGIVDVLV